MRLTVGLRVLVGLSLVLVAGCTSNVDPDALGVSVSSSPSSSASSQLDPSLASRLDGYREVADRMNVPLPGSLSQAAARPTVTETDGVWTTMVIHDQDALEWKPGIYRLNVYCVGVGRVSAQFSVGSVRSLATLLPECTAGGSFANVDVQIDAKAASSDVIITPVGTTQAAVAYQTQRIHTE